MTFAASWKGVEDAELGEWTGSATAARLCVGTSTALGYESKPSALAQKGADPSGPPVSSLSP